MHMVDLPAEKSIVSFEDDALVVCAADDIGILELSINESLRWAKRWLNSRCLEMASQKIKALMDTDKRSFGFLKIVRGEHEVAWKRRIKYLGV